ncbi:MAG TPA: DMSO/selenate family reductase complex A subunit [Bacteroidales bacterium]|nr:DMSO/selenate family reductase complex A subunit [Bacteroidales bacterium]
MRGEKKAAFDLKTDRRGFIKWSSLVSGGLIASPILTSCVRTDNISAAEAIKEETFFRTGCPSHNCGGRCLLKVYVREGVITRIETDDRQSDDISDPQLRACIRGRAYRKRQYHPDRLKYPLLRTGNRGAGEFRRISWDEAYDIMYREISRVIETYGNSAIHCPYGTGSYTNTNGRWPAARLLNLLGGSLGFYNSYSWACINIATPYMFGTLASGNQRQDWLNSKYIIMWGWNPAEMKDGTNSDFFIKKARENGSRIICIDPRLSQSAVALADEWIPVRPGTDVAFMNAMAYTIISENLTDNDFIDRCTMGFDPESMPEGYENAESYKEYILGTGDGIPKSPEWAEKITAVPAGTISRIAREYSMTKPAVLYQGYGMQRRAYGEQVVRAGATLAAITGNIGIKGGWASGLANQAGGGPFWNIFPSGNNPVKASIPCFLWTEAVLKGKEMGAGHGVRGTEKLDNNIKLIWSVASNILVNQHANVNRTIKILKDETLLDYIIVQDNFMTPSAKYADLVLPACTQFETWGLEDGWKYGEEVFLTPKIVEPPFETKSDYRICADLADRFGVYDRFTEGGRDEKDWVAWLIDETYRKTRFPEMPVFRKFEKSNAGVYSKPVTDPKVAFRDFRDNPEKNPLDTPSGKIEIFSPALYDMDLPEGIPAIPKYIEEWESPFGTDAEKYPLQAMGHHYMPRVHSTHDNNAWSMEAFPQRVFMNPVDAVTRKIRNGDMVRIFNDRGRIILKCRITDKIMPGVIDIPQGAWYKPDRFGNDLGGNINVLTSEKWTPLAKGNAQHTIMVQIEKTR